MDNDVQMNLATNDTTACRDCLYRGRDNVRAAFCKVYEKTPKPARVFRGVPCAYYVREKDSYGKN